MYYFNPNILNPLFKEFVFQIFYIQVFKHKSREKKLTPRFNNYIMQHFLFLKQIHCIKPFQV